ncbi:MAG: hypothetical protein FJZ57_02310 [Chlamydiae bacterium]|nr:hypothetical protein [Chlamydiota bacterium]
MAINVKNNFNNPGANSLHIAMQEPRVFDSIASFLRPDDISFLAQSAKGIFDTSARNFEFLAIKEIQMMVKELTDRGSHKHVASQLTKIAEVSNQVYRKKKWSFSGMVLSVNSSAVYALAQLPVSERNHLLLSLALRKPAKEMIMMAGSISNHVQDANQELSRVRLKHCDLVYNVQGFVSDRLKPAVVSLLNSGSLVEAIALTKVLKIYQESVNTFIPNTNFIDAYCNITKTLLDTVADKRSLGAVKIVAEEVGIENSFLETVARQLARKILDQGVEPAVNSLDRRFSENQKSYVLTAAGKNLCWDRYIDKALELKPFLMSLHQRVDLDLTAVSTLACKFQFSKAMSIAENIETEEGKESAYSIISRYKKLYDDNRLCVIS